MALENCVQCACACLVYVYARGHATWLFHFSQVIRAPLLFNEGFSLDPIMNTRGGRREINLYLSSIMNSYIKDYTRYVEDVLGCRILAVDDKNWLRSCTAVSRNVLLNWSFVFGATLLIQFT